METLGGLPFLMFLEGCNKQQFMFHSQLSIPKLGGTNTFFSGIWTHQISKDMGITMARKEQPHRTFKELSLYLITSKDTLNSVSKTSRLTSSRTNTFGSDNLNRMLT